MHDLSRLTAASASRPHWCRPPAPPSIRAIGPITLELSTTNYLQWCTMFTDALQKYALDDHVDASACPAAPSAQWIRHDAIVRSWLNGTVAPELLATVVNPAKPPAAHELWSRIAALYHDNADTHTSYLEQAFHGLQQDSMSIDDYCRKQKNLADELNALGTTVTDRSLVQNTLRGLSSRLKYMRTLLLKQRPLPSFLDVRYSSLRVLRWEKNTIYK
jgi:hypothetical protein